MPKKQAGENTKKVAGNAKKAESARQKSEAESSKKAAVEDAEWSKGAKSNAKKEDAEARKAEAARKKAEKDALLAAEEASLPSKAKPNPKAPKKSGRGLDLSSLDDEAPSAKSTALNATGIDNALDALSLTSGATHDNVDKHPERRFKAAYAVFEARRLPEVEDEHKGLRRQQRIELVRKEFEKSDENPFNQVAATYDASKEELKELRQAEREKIERRLGSS